MIPRGLLPPRKPDTHKGDVGRVFLLAGSRGMSGAAALCTLGALRVGAGLVTLGIPKSLHDPMVEKLTEAMLKILPETKEGSLSLQGLPEIVSTIERVDAAAIGPVRQHPGHRRQEERGQPTHKDDGPQHPGRARQAIDQPAHRHLGQPGPNQRDALTREK